MTADPDDPEDNASFIPADHLAAVGRIANAWASLEFVVDQTTWGLAAIPHMVGACMTAQLLSIQPKFNALIALAQLRGLSTETVNRLKKFQSVRIGRLQQGRNRAVHDVRVLHNATGEIKRLQITAQGPLVFEFQPEPISDLHKLRKKIEAAIRDCSTLRDDVLAEFRALPDKSGRPLFDIQARPLEC